MPATSSRRSRSLRSAVTRPSGTSCAAGPPASASDPVAGLKGPIGVLPAHQGHGVGTAPLHAVLAAADALEVPLVALLGSRDYYSRFGFVPAARLGIDAPDQEWGDAFQARALRRIPPRDQGPVSVRRGVRIALRLPAA